MIRLRWLAAGTLAAALTLGCGGSPKPVAQIAKSEASIRGANEAGAPSVPAATLYLKLAQEQHQKGLALVEDDENDEAISLFLRSQADAELAIALARAARAEHDAAEAQLKVETVKENAK